MKRIICIILVIVICIVISIAYAYSGYKKEYNEVQNFNSNFSQYIDKEFYGNELATIINRAIDNNEKNKIPKDLNGRYIEDEMYYIKVDIYINDNYITTTTQTSIDLDISSYDGDIKFVVKTAWSKNKTTISSGSEFTYSKSEASLVSVTPKGLPIVNIALNTHYVDESVLVLDNLKDVTSECNITTIITNSNNDLLSSVDTSTEDTYKIEYIVKYKNKTYRTTRTVIVS